MAKKKKPKRLKRLGYRLEYAAAYALGLLSGAIGQRHRVRLGMALGRLAAALAPGLAETARKNMRLAFPGKEEEEIRSLLKANAAHMGRLAMEFLAARRMSATELASIIRFENAELYERCFAQGKGVIVLAMHIGNWELNAMAVSSFLGKPLTAIGKRIHNPFIDKLVIATRERFGTTFINNRQAARPLLRHLKGNGAVGILNDQRPSRGEWVPSVFFGETVATNPGLATIALRSGAQVICTYCLTDGPDYVIRFEGPVEPPKDDGDSRARIVEFTRKLDEVIERCVRERPAEWLWMHDRWKLPKGFETK